MPVSSWFARSALLLTFWAGACLALPAPHDIEDAVAKGQLAQAEQMLREVLAEKPRSARAHYELAQVLAREGQHSQALQALRTARALEPELGFAQSPDTFRQLEGVLERQAREGQAQPSPRAAPALTASPAATGMPTTPTPPSNPASKPAWWWPALLSAGFGLAVLALWRRMAAPVATARPAPWGPETGGAAPRGFGAAYDPRGPMAGGPYAPAPSPTPAASPGQTVAGAVVGGLAGVAAGYALSRALEGSGGHDGRSGADSSGRGFGGPTDTRSPDPMEDVGRVWGSDPGVADLGSFDAGRGDDWGGDSGTDSDSW